MLIILYVIEIFKNTVIFTFPLNKELFKEKQLLNTI